MNRLDVDHIREAKIEALVRLAEWLKVKINLPYNRWQIGYAILREEKRLSRLPKEK